VADNEADIEECYKACEHNNVNLMCSFQRRYDPNYAKVVQVVHSGALGELRSIHAVFRDFPVPPLEFLLKGGCVFHDLAVHDVDFVRYLTSQEPNEVFATSSSFLPALKVCVHCTTKLRSNSFVQEAGISDQAHALFRFPSGLVFTIELSRSSPFGYDNRIEVCGSEGVLQVGNVPATSVVHSKGLCVAGDSPIGSFPERYLNAYQVEVDSFGEVLAGRSQPLVTCLDSLRASRIAEAARQSSIKGVPVKIA
jgi:myo-inositol 2-dehydrogenase/D-chiro-inositol 1-dehydrogenase